LSVSLCFSAKLHAIFHPFQPFSQNFLPLAVQENEDQSLRAVAGEHSVPMLQVPHHPANPEVTSPVGLFVVHAFLISLSGFHHCFRITRSFLQAVATCSPILPPRSKHPSFLRHHCVELQHQFRSGTVKWSALASPAHKVGRIARPYKFPATLMSITAAYRGVFCLGLANKRPAKTPAPMLN
jgi:hypothetical protein